MKFFPMVFGFLKVFRVGIYLSISHLLVGIRDNFFVRSQGGTCIVLIQVHNENKLLEN